MICQECFMEVEPAEFHDYNCCLEFKKKTALTNFHQFAATSDKQAKQFAFHAPCDGGSK